ncbi:MAG: hypothetical protein R6W31_19210, partial [Bacteroidales bacterium]
MKKLSLILVLSLFGYGIACEGVAVLTAEPTGSVTLQMVTSDDDNNKPPEVSGIPDQLVGPCETFVTISLDDYVEDDDTPDADISWSFSGNEELLVSITDRIATITLPTDNWYGSENIRFIATDDDADDPQSDSDVASFTVTQIGVPSIETITQPTCSVATGSVGLSGLPDVGTWTLTRSPGGATSTGTGTSTTINGLSTGTYSWTVTNAAGCISESSSSAVINTAPVTPAAPTVGTITQPNCNVVTGSVTLTGLPADGSWTLTRSPGGTTTTGTGTSRTISGLTTGTYTWTVTNADGCTSDASDQVVINVGPVIPAAPTVGTITQPTCSVSTGSVPLSGLPSGSWTLTRTPGGTTSGSGSTTTVTGLTTGTYTWTVTNEDGCTSESSSSAVINTAPDIPAAPTVGTITQPNCSVVTGSVTLTGLPADGSWTLTRSPGGTTTTGTGTSRTISGLTTGTYTWTVTNADG